MLHLSNRNVGPPGSFRYRIVALADRAPALAMVGPYHSFRDLCNEVAKRCMANGLPVPSETAIEDQLCQSLPPGHCRDELGQVTLEPGNLALSLADVVQGTRTLASWFLNGRKRVTRDETVRRTYICNECPHNVSIAGCQGCSGHSLRALVNEVVANEPLPTDTMLGACNVCRCSLPAKVRMPLSDILPHMTADQKGQLWEKCWIRDGFDTPTPTAATTSMPPTVIT